MTLPGTDSPQAINFSFTFTSGKKKKTIKTYTRDAQAEPKEFSIAFKLPHQLRVKSARKEEGAARRGPAEPRRPAKVANWRGTPSPAMRFYKIGFPDRN